MARWRLITGHYLNVPGTEWEYKETDRGTGKQVRKVFPVPMLLDPNDGSHQNYPGAIIVTNKEDRAFPNDILFVGDPTPDMDPLDDEAEAISASFKDRWIHPIEALPGQSFSQSLLDDLQRQVAAMQTDDKVKPKNIGGIDPASFAQLQAQVAELAKQNAALLEQLSKPQERRA